jgi:hypothetical protein
MDVNSNLEALLKLEILQEGPDESIWKRVRPIMRKKRYRSIRDYESTEKALVDIEEDLAKVQLMRNFARLKNFFSKLKQVTNPILLVSVTFGFVFMVRTDAMASEALSMYLRYV